MDHRGPPPEFGALLRTHRTKRGWVQSALSQRLGQAAGKEISDKRISEWERGAVVPSVTHVGWLCDVFELSTDSEDRMELVEAANRERRPGTLTTTDSPRQRDAELPAEAPNRLGQSENDEPTAVESWEPTTVEVRGEIVTAPTPTDIGPAEAEETATVEGGEKPVALSMPPALTPAEVGPEPRLTTEVRGQQGSVGRTAAASVHGNSLRERILGTTVSLLIFGGSAIAAIFLGSHDKTSGVSWHWSDAASAAGLSGQTFLLLLALLMARIPLMWKLLDQRQVIELHRYLGVNAVWAIGLHVAINAATRFHEFRWEEMTFTAFSAAAAVVLLILGSAMASPIFYEAVFPKEYERWFAYHRVVLLAVLISLVHEWRAPTVDRETPAGVIWFSAHLLVLIVYFVFRRLRPWIFHLRHELAVAENCPLPSLAPPPVIGDGDPVSAQDNPTSESRLRRIRIKGRSLDGIRPHGASALGYAYLSFETSDKPKGDPHPYSLARTTDPLRLEIVVDTSRDPNNLKTLRENDFVRLDGPHGQMRPWLFRRREHVAVLANGTAITSSLPLLLDLLVAPAYQKRVLAVFRVTSWNELPADTRQTLTSLMTQYDRLQVVLLDGSEADGSWLGNPTNKPSNRPPSVKWYHFQANKTPAQIFQELGQLSSEKFDFNRCEIYLLGGEGWSSKVYAALRTVGRSPHRLHREYPTWDRPRRTSEQASEHQTKGLFASERSVIARIKTKWRETHPTGTDSPLTPPIGVALLRRLPRLLLTSPAVGAAVIILTGLAIGPFVRDTTGVSAEGSGVGAPVLDGGGSVGDDVDGGIAEERDKLREDELLDYVEIPTTYEGVPVDLRHYEVKGVTTFHGRTMLDQHEQLWLLLAVPEDPSVSDTADRRGPFVVGTSDRIRPNRRGFWDGKIDIGRGKCDQGATFYVLQVVSRPSNLGAGRSVIDRLRHRGEDYPKLPEIPHDSKAVGGVEVTMERYNGGHTLCPGR